MRQPSIRLRAMREMPTCENFVAWRPSSHVNVSPATTITLPNLDRLWHETLGDPRVAIGVLDGPVDVAHPAFAQANLELVDAGIAPVAREGPAAEHGTHVASVIFAGHGSGPLRGIAPSCRGVIIPIFADGPRGTIRTASQFDLARAIDLAMTRGVSVISISSGQFRPSGAAHPT